MKRIYMDHASVTPVRKEVLKAVTRAYKAYPGNPSSIHAEGVAAKKAVTSARVTIAACLKAHADEIVFTASGTEANNLAVLGLVRGVSEASVSKPHVLISAVEHASVRECAEALKKIGADVEEFGVTAEGVADLADLRKKLRPETVLVSAMAVNNETGAITSIPEIAKVIRRHRTDRKAPLPYLHVDASQAPLWMPVNMEKWHADLATFDGHKMHGPRGVGMLYVRRGLKLAPVIVGGGQETGLRSGTENLPGILGLAKAFELAERDREKDRAKVAVLAERVRAAVTEAFPAVSWNGRKEMSVPGILNFSLPGIDTEFLALQLDAAGIAVSVKSSCLRDEGESYVLKAMGKPAEAAKASLRISLGRGNTKGDVRKFAKVLKDISTRHASQGTSAVVQ